MREIGQQAGGDVSIIATPVLKRNGAAKKALDDRPAFGLQATYGSGERVQDLVKGKDTIAIPCVLAAGQKAGSVQAVSMDSEVHWLLHSVYDNEAQVLRFVTCLFTASGAGYSSVPTGYAAFRTTERRTTSSSPLPESSSAAGPSPPSRPAPPLRGRRWSWRRAGMRKRM